MKFNEYYIINTDNSNILIDSKDSFQYNTYGRISFDTDNMRFALL